MELSDRSVQQVEEPAQIGKPYFRSRRFERHYPYWGSMAAALLIWLLGDPVPAEAVYGAALMASFTVAAIACGFLGTATAVLTGLDSRPMRRIRDSAAILSLAAYLIEGIVAGFLVMLVAMVGFFMSYPFHGLYVVIWAGLLTFLALAFFRVVYIMVGLMAEHPRQE